MEPLIQELQEHIAALKSRAEHHQKQKLLAVSQATINDHLMCMLELTRQADDLKAIVDRYARPSYRA